MEKTTIHIIGTPGNASRQEPTIDPFSRSSYYLTNSLHGEGWRVNYYGYEESNPGCTKKFGVVNMEWKLKWTTHSDNSAPVLTEGMREDFRDRVFDKLKDNVIKGDIIIDMWSNHYDGDKIRKLTPYVIDGHVGHYAPSPHYSYHVYACHALQSFIYGKNDHMFNCRWNDAVIPPISHSMYDFEFNPYNEGYILFMSRLIENKGLGVVLDVATNMPDQKFKIAGSGDISYFQHKMGDNVEFIGYLDGDKRRDYMSKAKAVITPALYFEPFGLTSVEAALSGTPIIATDWGGYTNNVLDGVTGFRCTTVYDFIDAINNLDKIDPVDCKHWGDLHSCEELVKKWKKYLIRVKRGGFYGLTSDEDIEKTFRM